MFGLFKKATPIPAHVAKWMEEEPIFRALDNIQALDTLTFSLDSIAESRAVVLEYKRYLAERIRRDTALMNMLSERLHAASEFVPDTVKPEVAGPTIPNRVRDKPTLTVPARPTPPEMETPEEKKLKSLTEIGEEMTRAAKGMVVTSPAR